MPKPAPCGLRISHDRHDLTDGGTCPGRPWPAHYEPKHHGLYQPEPDWTCQPTPRPGRHRKDGPCVLAGEPDPPRPWIRLGWRDERDERGTAASSTVAAACCVIAAFTGLSATSAGTSFDQLVRSPVLIAKKSED